MEEDGLSEEKRAVRLSSGVKALFLLPSGYFPLGSLLVGD